MNIENIKNKIKTVCENNPSLGVLADEFEIKEENVQIFTHIRNYAIYVNAIKIYNIKDGFCYYLTCDTNDIDIASKLFQGYLNQRFDFNKEKAEKEYQKKHPILGIFK